MGKMGELHRKYSGKYSLFDKDKLMHFNA